MTSSNDALLPDFNADFFSPFGEDASDIKPIKTKGKEIANPYKFDINPITGEKDDVTMLDVPIEPIPKTEVSFNEPESNSNVSEVEEIAPIAPLIDEPKTPAIDLNELLVPSTEERTTKKIDDPVASIPDILDGSMPEDPLDETILKFEKENRKLKSDYQEKSGRLTALLNNNKDIFERVNASSRELTTLSTQLRNLAIEVLQQENQSHMKSLSKLDEILVREEKKQKLYAQKLEENRRKAGEIEAVMSSMKRRIAFSTANPDEQKQ